MRFRTTVTMAPHNRHAGEILTVEEWEARGGWNGAMTLGWKVERPDWWRRGCTSAVTDATVEAARAALDRWQDEVWEAERR